MGQNGIEKGGKKRLKLGRVNALSRSQPCVEHVLFGARYALRCSQGQGGVQLLRNG